MLQGFCEHLKERGRNGGPFCFALATVLGMGTLGAWGVVVFVAALVVGIGWVWVSIADQRQKFEKLGKMPPLSENDLSRARSKLVSRAKR